MQYLINSRRGSSGTSRERVREPCGERGASDGNSVGTVRDLDRLGPPWATEPRGAHREAGGPGLSCSGDGISSHGSVGSTPRCDIWRRRWGFDLRGDGKTDG